MPRSCIGVLGLTLTTSAAVFAGCGGSSPTAPPSTPPPTAPAVFTASVTDPAGDVRADNRVPRSPDLVGAFIEIKDNVVRFRVEFAPGSYERSTSGVHVLLDLDQNAATGLPGTGASEDMDVIGADAVIALNVFQPVFFVSKCTSQVTDWRSANTPCTVSGPIALTREGDIAEGSFPLSTLADDGRMRMKVVTWVTMNSASGPTTDSMTDVGQPAISVQ